LDEDIKRQVLAMPESDCRLEKVIKFIEAEESGKYSLSDTKDLASVTSMSTYKKQQRVNEGEAPQGSPFADKCCENCGKLGHTRNYRQCPAKKWKCDSCGKVGHYRKCCLSAKNGSTRQSDNKSDEKKTGKEAHSIHEVMAIHGHQYLPDHKVMEEVMEWDHGDLSLIKGITVDSTHQQKSGRRVLKYTRFDKKTG
jgi:hypothetical protein